MVSIDTALKGKFLQYLREREYSLVSILKYARNFEILSEYADSRPVDKERPLGFRQFLLGKATGRPQLIPRWKRSIRSLKC